MWVEILLSANFNFSISSYRASGMWVEIESAVNITADYLRHTARAVCGLKFSRVKSTTSKEVSYRASGMWVEIAGNKHIPSGGASVIPRERYVG